MVRKGLITGVNVEFYTKDLVYQINEDAVSGKSKLSGVSKGCYYDISKNIKRFNDKNAEDAGVFGWIRKTVKRPLEGMRFIGIYSTEQCQMIGICDGKRYDIKYHGHYFTGRAMELYSFKYLISPDIENDEHRRLTKEYFPKFKKFLNELMEEVAGQKPSLTEKEIADRFERGEINAEQMKELCIENNRHPSKIVEIVSRRLLKEKEQEYRFLLNRNFGIKEKDVKELECLVLGMAKKRSDYKDAGVLAYVIRKKIEQVGAIGEI